jgi:hypothetical protein
MKSLCTCIQTYSFIHKHTYIYIKIHNNNNSNYIYYIKKIIPLYLRCSNYEIKIKLYEFMQTYRSRAEFMRIIEPNFVSTIGSFIKRTKLDERVVSFTSQHVSQECRRREIILLQEASSGSFNERNILNGGR